MKTIPEAAKLLDSLKSLQDKGHKFPCPRCGHDRMAEKPVHNSLSRYAEVYICRLRYERGDDGHGWHQPSPERMELR